MRYRGRDLLILLESYRVWLLNRLQNSRFRKAGSAVSVILKCKACEPHMPAGRVTRENDCRLFDEFVLRRGCKMLLRWQILLNSSTHILNLIPWMPYFRAKFAVLSSKAWSFVHSVQWWFGKDERFCFSVKYRTCPFLKRLKSVKWIKQHRKNRPRVEEESQKKRQRRTIADCVCVVLKHSLEIDFCCV